MKKRVFTLTELVVVMVCITILAAVLSACGDGGARERARNANCVSKLKQIGSAEFMYSTNNRDYVAVTDPFDPDTIVPQVRSALAPDGTPSGIYPVNAGDKLLMGGYLGETLSEESNEAKARFFRCPSDETNWRKSGTVSSYNNAVLAREATFCSAENPRRRMVVGRDNPGAAAWYDHHQALVRFCGSRDGNNHRDSVNICYFGGHVGSVSVRNVTDVKWDFLDQITY